MNEKQALAAVQSILGGGPAGVEKTAAPAQTDGPLGELSGQDLLLKLGEERLAEIYEEAHEKLAEAQIEEGATKVAMILRDEAIRSGILPGVVKQACPNDPTLQQALLEIIEHSAA